DHGHLGGRDQALRPGDAPDAADPRDQAGWQGRRATGALPAACAGRLDDNVAHWTGRAGARERALHRVGQDEGPGHKRHAERDRRGGQDQPQPVGQQAGHGYPQHPAYASSSLIASRTRAWVGSASSPAAVPSARNTTRSATAAAAGSWVTITTVWP